MTSEQVQFIDTFVRQTNENFALVDRRSQTHDGKLTSVLCAVYALIMTHPDQAQFRQALQLVAKQLRAERYAITMHVDNVSPNSELATATFDLMINNFEKATKL